MRIIKRMVRSDKLLISVLILTTLIVIQPRFRIWLLKTFQRSDHFRRKEIILPRKTGKNQRHALIKSTQQTNKAKEDCSLDWQDGLFTASNSDYEKLKLNPKELQTKTSSTDISTNPVPLVRNPLLKLNKQKFMMPILMRGPNNQLIGLRESIYVAIRLNRTLVIPRFIKHRTDSQLDTGKFIHPGHRLDFSNLCNFISCITMDQFRKACGYQVDVIFRLRHYSPKRLSEMESSLGMRLAASANNGINLLPSNIKTKTDTNFGPKEKEIKDLFQSTKMCALYANPYYNLKIRNKPGKHRLKTQKDLPSLSDTEVFSEIIRHTMVPKYIRKLAKDFVATVIKGGYISVHWRYNSDWKTRCDRSTSRQQLCKEAKGIIPEDIAKAITTKLKTTRSTTGNIAQIYIAAPPSEQLLITKVATLLQSEKGYRMFGQKDLVNYINNRQLSCDFLSTHRDDIISTLEMEICRTGEIFLRSTRSSWSSNVIETRRHSYIKGTLIHEDEDVLFLTRKIAQERLKSEKARQAR